MSTRRLPESARTSENARPGLLPPPSSLSELSVPQLYRPESSTSIDHWAPTERDQLHYPATRPAAAEYTAAGIPPEAMPQWRPPRRSHYTYPQHNPLPAPLETAGQPRPGTATATTTPAVAGTTPFGWAPPTSHPFGAAGYSASGGYPGPQQHPQHPHQHHPHAYERAPVPSANAYPPPQAQPQAQPLQTQPAAPSELTDLGLVSQESRLDERWTSFMRDSGYFEGFGYRGR